MTLEKEDSRRALERIQKAAVAIKGMRPAYEKILSFYEKIFSIQEVSAFMVEVAHIKIRESVLSAKKKEKMPLVQLSEFVVDYKRSVADFIQICNILKEANPKMAKASPGIIEALDRKLFLPESLFDALLDKKEGTEKTPANVADALGLDSEVLSFVVYNSVLPSITKCKHRLSDHLDLEDAPFDKGYCPICGNPPKLSSLEKDGARFLFCGFCWHKWRVKRIYCPFCENTTSAKLNYLYAEDEEEYRVDGCDNCKKYLKTIDTRKLDRPFYPRLEEVATLHLDMIQEKVA